MPRAVPRALATAVAALVAVPLAGLGATADAAGPRSADPTASVSSRPAHARATPKVTRAGLDPSLVRGRGAKVAFVEQEAENAVGNGEVISGREAYTLPAEASGRSAVRLDRAGEYVEFTLTGTTNALNLRYSIPDAATGGGIEAPLAVSVNGRRTRTMTLTSRYSWLYGMYPFSNDPAVDPNPGWWKPEPDPVTKPFRPMHFYDEQRLLLGHTYHAGDRVRFAVPAGTNAAWYVLDLADFEHVAKPKAKPRRALSVVAFGADRTGRRDSSAAFDAAIAAARSRHRSVYIPAGEFKISRHIVVDDVTVRGAGNWWSVIRGTLTPLDQPAPDRSTHDAPGFYGKYVEQGGSEDVHLSDFAIESDVRERIDPDQVNGIGGALGGGSTVERLYIHHVKVGMWFDGPFDGLTVRDNIIVDTLADALNLRRGISNVRVSNNFIRNTGDDGLAMWSEDVATPAPNGGGNADHDDVFDHNTVQSPSLANGIAIYGGRDNAVTDNLVADPVREGSALHAGSRFGATPFEGTLSFARNTTVRGGPRELNWNIGLGSIWFYALERSMDARIDVTDSDILDSTHSAFLFVVDFPVKDQYTISNVHVRNVRVDGTGTSVVNARVGGWASFEDVDARNVGTPFLNNCGTFHFTGTPEFDVRLVGDSNDGGWTSPVGCEDRPTPVPPPPPSRWDR